MVAASWSAGWWAWIAPATLQATLLLGAAWILDRLFARRAWPQVLAILWLVALVRAFLPPGLSSPWSVTAPLGEPTLAAAKWTSGAGLLTFGFALWLGGAALFVAVRCVGRVRLAARLAVPAAAPEWRRALARAWQALGRGRAPELATLEGLASPAVFGLLWPKLVLPRAWLERRPTRRDWHALLHEAAHLRRGDLWRDELCALLRAGLWFHPLAWIATERLHALAELQADQLVVRALGRGARSYRDTLVLAAHGLLAAPGPAGLRGFVASPSALVLRIERLERATGSLAVARGASAALAVALAACVLPMAPWPENLRAQARAVFERELRGEHQSCFVLQAAAHVLAADSKSSSPDP